MNRSPISHPRAAAGRLLLVLVFLLIPSTLAYAQSSTSTASITIGGNVYGGGNEGNTGGNTNVTIRTGQIKNVFGGACMADVGGRAFVNIDGEHGSGMILISAVYGGNDISGTVGTSLSATDTGVDKLPAELTNVLQSGETKETYPEKNAIDNTWSACVRTSPMSTEYINAIDDANCILVGSVYGGGNGEYTYTDANGAPLMDSEGNYIAKSGDVVIATSTEPFSAPTVKKTYLELNGGCLSQVYGGGNNATVTENTTISMYNTSKGLQSLFPSTATQADLMYALGLLSAYTGISTFQGDYTSLDYTSSRVFGGNNQAEMTIRPVWNLQRGKLRDLYSGGNEGNMTHPEGLILDVKPSEANSDFLSIVNVYGGCRRADVHPTYSDGSYPRPSDVQLPVALGYHFPAGLPARTIVRGGKVTNVYGGNDISGRVFGGNAVGIYTTVYGNVYGGGNGSYSYTDNENLKNLPGFKDFYYNPTEVRDKERVYSGNNSFAFTAGYESVEALNIFRPNAEQVSILVKGTETNPTIIRGSVYIGGNSASLHTESSTLSSGADPMVELKIGSYAIIDKVFLGNNGANMVTEDILKLYAGGVDTNTGAYDASGVDYSTMTLTDKTQFAKYMEGCAMSIKPKVKFEGIEEATDPDTYVDYSSQIGSFYCGGNRGSMTWPGNNTINFNKKVIIFDKFVGGCNDANIAATAYNAEYLGGMIGSPEEQTANGMLVDPTDPNSAIKDCMTLNFSGLKILPKRWVQENGADVLDANGNPQLEWNTFCYTDGVDSQAPAISGSRTINRNTPADQHEFDRRLRGGNIYGGCYESGHTNGNVVINIIDDIVDLTGPYAVFDIVTKASPLLYGNDEYTITQRNSGVILDEQGMDPLGIAVSVFGGGYGPASEVWGSATVNLRAGHTFQIFGGGQQGPIGKSREDNGETSFDGSDYVFNGKHYQYDARYSTYVNMEDDDHVAGSTTADIPEIQFIYGGSFEAPIAGNTHVYLGNGRIFNSFAGSCNADILGHAETYIGKGVNRDGSATDGQIIDAFPYIVDHIYGGNDLGGKILGEMRAEQYPSATDAAQALADCDFTTRVGTTNGQDLTKVYQYDASANPNPSVLTASAYIEYTAGHVVNIFGGAYGDYDYTAERYREYCNADGSNKAGFSKPRLGNAFVNFKPAVSSNALTAVSQVYGAGQGRHAVIDRDVMQERSYILVDIPQTMQEFQRTVFFGAGAYGGVGMERTPVDALADPDKVSAVIDLVRGDINDGNVYGGSYKEGITRRTLVNVPVGSTISAKNIFGGAYGVDVKYPCDVYEAIVNYSSNDAQMTGKIYGGNNNARRTFYGKVNISSPVWTNKAKGYTGTVFGAGYGADTWSQYTEVNLLDGALVSEAYGGGEAGKVLNLETVNKWMAEDNTIDFNLTSGYTDFGLASDVANCSQLEEDLAAGLVNREDSWKNTGSYTKKKYNTNVSIKAGATVNGYCYGGGLGADAVVSGTSYIDLLGGIVGKDLYGAGTSGAVMDWKGVAKDGDDSNDFIASANVYIKGGTARNVYGGGWEGPVGYHDESTVLTTNDILGETHVVIGVLRDLCAPDPDPNLTYLSGVPTVQRNAYGGGEGGVIYGTANITVNNGYIGYVYNDTGSDDATTDDFDERYEEKIADETYDTGSGYGNNERLRQAGNVFGSGYADYSNADFTNVYLYGGVVRNSAYGGGEIGTVGRGANRNGNVTVHKAGEAHVFMYKGHVIQDVFGGGRGFDNLNRVSALGTGGYVFGLTDVNIYGGEVGTTAGVADGYGNVFGGGNLGYVYSGLGTKSATDGYYYNSSTNLLTEDSRVIVAPACQVLCGETITLNGHEYNAGQYVPAEDLSFLKNKNDFDENTQTGDSLQWIKLDAGGDHSGVIIRNAVFAGGNVSSGSDQVYANTVTVYGNATATLYDIYNRDLITIGTEHVGGLYGDGNLTFVDGYRELNVSNYGTDYYGMSDNISLEEYYKLTDRERAYFELKYKCKTSYTSPSTSLGRTVNVGEQIKAEDYNKMDTEEQANWELGGFCTIYAGRLLNTLQRADFVGVFGSRMVLQGAQDRVPQEVDYTNYTINRVGEVSLNKSDSQAGDTGDGASHGSYFGIYSIVNYLGALTSDVNFSDGVRTYDNKEGDTYKPDFDGQTYKEWKAAHLKERKRNNGTSHNKVALASGVYLELTTEESTRDNKVWGLITGVCQLDLINVMEDEGGGYVYAKNEHGVRTSSGNDLTILSPYNMAGYGHGRAVTNKIYQYSTTNLETYETSGNFIHNSKQIIDDCYPSGGSYSGNDAAPAHYWYIRGQIYVYDQVISAYTGSASAYSETVNLPLTITPSSNGVLQLNDVKQNYYAYYDETTAGSETKIGSEGILVGITTYHLNDPITYWEYNLLSDEDKKHFVEQTYVSTAACTVTTGTAAVPAGAVAEGTVLLPSEYEALKNLNATVTAPTLDATNPVPFDDVFHMTNNISHGTGYILTYDMTNPKVWDRYYTPPTGASLADNVANKVTTATYEGDLTTYGTYIAAPTYTPTTSAVYGQREYEVGDIIPDDIHAKYAAISTNGHSYPGGQATVAQAYVATGEATYTINGVEHHVYKGYPIPATEYAQLDAATQAKFATASICTSTIELGNNEYIFYGDLLTDAEIATYKATYQTFLEGQGLSSTDAATKADSDFATSVLNAWYCSEAGKYGGDWYEASHNYRALEAWSALSEEDRAHFTFNYDAFDALIDPDFSGNTLKYDGYDGNTLLQTLYSDVTPVDYKATYDGAAALTYTDASDQSNTVAVGTVLDRVDFEAIPNEKRFYQGISIPSDGTYYFVKVAFTRGDVPYTVGTMISPELYNVLDNSQKLNVMTKTLTTGTYFFCRKPYHVNEKGEGYAVTDIGGVNHAKGTEVTVGTIISESEYAQLPNKQAGFTIHGDVPIGTSTLYVARQSDINDLSKEKVVTVIYDYVYEESDESGTHISEIREKHVINIHLQFKSGVPAISELEKPAIVLPSSTVGLKQPNVTPGAFEIIGGGWEMFTNQTDAEQHTNGIPYYNNLTPMYWYQNNYYVAYYAKSYLGKTYSNAVQFTVANYHDIDSVMNHPRHLFVDHPEVSRPSKIYIDSRECTDNTKSKLDQLKDFFTLTLHNSMDADGNPTTIADGSAVDGHLTVNAHIKGGANLDFILQSDISPKKYTTWEPIGDASQCFEGVFHGNGYTVSGLSNSLFGSLCGSVYNLGVTGSFTSAGVVDTGDGYVENCWVSTTGTLDGSVHAVFGNPTRSDGTQVVNCYYPADNAYDETASERGNAIKKPRQSFYNGEVAYDLNGFYLNKRYNDHQATRPTGYSLDGNPLHPYYKFWDADDLDESTNKPKLKQGGYEAETNYALGYVEEYYKDGDFVYAGGRIPEGDNERYSTADGKFYPIWPDDYIFFGQMLTYGHVDSRPHQSLPAHVNKSSNRLTTTAASVNRVYRAPAYFRNSTMGVAYYNPYAVFAANSADNTHTAYPNMTAIDFTGGNGDLAGGYEKGVVTVNGSEQFYPPLIDIDGLTFFRNVDLTRNLLAYTPNTDGNSSHADTKTYTAVMTALAEPAYTETNASTYRTVAAQDVSSIHGHAVVKTASDTYTATNDHLLVDKQDFNAPMAYTFDSDHRIWYQRRPDLYAGQKKNSSNEVVFDDAAGWEGISLPFEAELVTTQKKGELTHFYGTTPASGENKYTVGHEYWLREYREATKTVNNSTLTVKFSLPAKTSSSDEKEVTNTFLYDYYYHWNESKDKNSDIYQTGYYASNRTYDGYPYLQASTPYLIGFPGQRYYEFDLSGVFYPSTAKEEQPAVVGQQVITFASKKGVSIAVSDNDKNIVTQDGYDFTPSYLNETGAAGCYVLNGDGSGFAENTSRTAFRPYFTVTSTPAPGYRSATRADVLYIGFDGEELEQPAADLLTRGLKIYGKKDAIYIESSLDYEATVIITTASGKLINRITVKPQGREVVPVNSRGVYIANHQKVAVL